MPTDTDSACEGRCQEHKGLPVRVHVSHAHHDWGWWIYCEAACAADRAIGLTVEAQLEPDDAD